MSNGCPFTKSDCSDDNWYSKYYKVDDVACPKSKSGEEIGQSEETYNYVVLYINFPANLTTYMFFRETTPEM